MLASEQSKVKLALIGVSPFVTGMTLELARADEVKIISSCAEFLEFLETPEAQDYNLLTAGSMLEGISILEIAQSLRASFSSTPVYFCHDSRNCGFDRNDFVRNGFTDAFLLPLDKESYKTTLENTVVKIKSLPCYRSVCVNDIDHGINLTFDMFVLLPGNRKYLKYSKSGEALEENRLARLKSHNVGSIFVPLDQMKKFYDYSASKLTSLSKNQHGLSETERKEKIQESVRNLLGSIFTTREEQDFEQGRRMMEDAKEIVTSFLAQAKENDLYSKLRRTVGDGNGSYSHMSNCSTIAALFSLATGIGDPEHLALAGLFHDLGLSQVPAEVHAKNPKDWTPDEKSLFEKHPEYSVNLVKEKRIALPEIVQTIILQHHERPDGKGFPNKLINDKIKPESQLLAIADQFEELTRFEMGKTAINPEAAFEIMKKEGLYNIVILEKLCKAFSKEN